MPLPVKAETIHMDGGIYYIITGKFSKVSSWLTFPSGPPQYVFDEQGILVDWAMDIGEASRYNQKWRSDTNALTQISISKVDESLGKLPATNSP
ncbi:MAG: hypothetical protein LBV12_10290 [Puniceicoccales bacterium]|jgi:hypothetical protein|nr:hypothetical protein [Puniceicoccales bacterium]